MVYSGTITTEAEIVIMAGENVDSTGDTEANRNLLVAQAEGFLSGFIQDDVVVGFAGYDTVTKTMLNEWAARYTATALILFNMQGYTSRVEAEDMINFHAFRMKRIEVEFKEGAALKQLGANK